MVSRVVHLHIGAPKTGTTYLQHRLAANTRSLARHAVSFPSHSRLTRPITSQFRAALDLLGQDWGGPPGHSAGAWAGLVDKVRGLDGNVIISHEILAVATVEQAETAHRDLDTEDLRIVYSARDLGRQLPAAWQESIKQGRSWTLAEFLRRAERGKPFFMKSFDIPKVLSTWGTGLDPQQVTLVVVPQKGAPPDTLWLRMCEALEVDPAWAKKDPEMVNPSLGAAQTEVLRRLNKRLGRQVAVEGEYDALVRGLANSGSLFSKQGEPTTLPRDAYGWIDELTGRYLEWIQASGIRVIGDLDDLLPKRPKKTKKKWRGPRDLRTDRLLSAALDALANVTTELNERPDPGRTFTNRAKREITRRLSN